MSRIGLAIVLTLVCGYSQAQDHNPFVAKIDHKPFASSIPKAKKVALQPPLAVNNVRVPYSSPPGYHRHITLDNRVIEHSDANFGSCEAHAGIARPYPKYFGTRAPTGRQSTIEVFSSPMIQQSGCPNGLCPQQNIPVRQFQFRSILRGRFR